MCTTYVIRVSFLTDSIDHNSLWKEKEISLKIFEPAAIEYQELDDNKYLNERYFDLLLDLKSLFNKLIDDKTLLSVFFLNMGIEKFCMFFERSNSKGTELNFIDIITAKIYKDFNLDSHVKQFKEKNKAVFFDDSVVESFVRYISFLKEKKVDRRTILTTLDGNDFTSHWEEICKLYLKVTNYLYSQDLLYLSAKVPYNTMFIPMMHFLKKIPHRDFSMLTIDQSNLFRFWFWGSLLNTRYGGGMAGSTNDVIVLDCEKLEQVAAGKTFDKEYLKHFKFNFTYEDLLDHTSTGAIFIGIMSIINSKYQLRNLHNSNAIDFRQPMNVHHIYPVNYLNSNFSDDSFENENYNSILNKMLIEKIPNIKFGKDAPSVYLNKPEIQKNTQIIESLNTHLIPNPDKLISGSLDNDYKNFTKNRYNKIVELLDREIVGMKNDLLDKIEKA